MTPAVEECSVEEVAEEEAPTVEEAAPVEEVAPVEGAAPVEEPGSGPQVIREEMVLRCCRDRGRERNPLSAVSSDIDTCRSLVGERKGIVGKGKDILLMGI